MQAVKSAEIYLHVQRMEPYNYVLFDTELVAMQNNEHSGGDNMYLGRRTMRLTAAFNRDLTEDSQALENSISSELQ